MELTHEFLVPAPIDTAWATFLDLERVGGCFPGATVTEATGDSFTGTVKVKLGPIALVYAGSGSFVERDDSAHRAVIEAKGKDKRGNGTAGATVVIQLVSTDDGASTHVDVSTDLAITGKPAQFGRGVMQDVSDKLLSQFVSCIESQFAAGGEAEGSGDSGASESAPEPMAEPTPDTGGPGAGSGAAASSGPVTQPLPPATPAEARPAVPEPRRQPAAVTADDSIDLGATVLPVLIKSYAPYLLAGAVGLAVGLALGRRGN